MWCGASSGCCAGIAEEPLPAPPPRGGAPAFPPPLPCAVRPHERAGARLLAPLLSAHARGGTPASIRVDLRRALLRGRGRDLAPIPHAWRWWAWQHLSGGAELEAAQPGLYRALLRLGPAPPATDATLRHDAHRTLPHVPFFGSITRPGPGQSQLYRLLTAYARLDPQLAYTQGMSFAAGVLLLAGLSEQAAFFAFASLMLRHGARELYVDGLPLAITAHAALAELLQRRRPRLAAHLDDLGILPPLYSTPWLLSAFVSSPLPPSTVLALFDVLLVDGEPGPLPPAAAVVAECARRGVPPPPPPANPSPPA